MTAVYGVIVLILILSSASTIIRSTGDDKASTQTEIVEASHEIDSIRDK